MALLPNALSGHVHSPVPHKRSPDRSGKTILTPLPLSSTAPSLLQAQTPSPNPSFSLSPSLSFRNFPFLFETYFPQGTACVTEGLVILFADDLDFGSETHPHATPTAATHTPSLERFPPCPRGSLIALGSG